MFENISFPSHKQFGMLIYYERLRIIYLPDKFYCGGSIANPGTAVTVAGYEDGYGAFHAKAEKLEVIVPCACAGHLMIPARKKRSVVYFDNYIVFPGRFDDPEIVYGKLRVITVTEYLYIWVLHRFYIICGVFV